MPGGRPTEYKQAYCDMLVEHMAQGKSVVSFAAFVDVSKQTLYTWAHKYPEFLDSLKKGQAKSRGWWEQQGQDGLWETTEYNDQGKPTKSKKINAAVWIFTMKSRFGLNDQEKVGSTSEDEVIEKELADIYAKQKSER